ncbi:MAG TPA: acid-shock protein [Thermopetrobacter sp.]|nr:acid-shock protein [Thermopetrobacter sp.]
MKTPLKLTLAAAALSLLGASAALAHGPGPVVKRPNLMKLDANGDGVITREEVAAARAKRFAKRDANGDGVITAAEIDAAIMKRLEKRKTRLRYRLLARLDADGDGTVTRDEFVNKRNRLFARLDLNGDGKITRQEVKRVRAKFRRRMKRRMMMRQWRKRHQMGNPAPYGPPR